MPGQRRADAQRNRTRILETAVAALTEGEALSLNAVAKRAGVGVGTVYRQFPTPEALVLAVYEHEAQDLVDAVPALLRRYEPPDAFRVWVTEHLAHYMATKRGLARALQAAGNDGHDGVFDKIAQAVAGLIDANVTAGAIRADVEARTVLRALSGLIMLKSDGDRRTESVKLVDLLWQGMRNQNTQGD
ncbi:TetR/AcrR family transcriptional regulator [Amycolatopsis pithecellobii]|uniref:TetR family transcriptional regulator n=1 Tax=Amycolatopsis pithecellobii TaxID=664692 RepID=A0A6N7Z9L5_9PSEU|nr:TetR/AcrR family transcriptional regulator [Amycolatopsis pithecellobii]MTD58424.1 TetR family transcriptional regulator [Amycolatopsis pithecellobii]